MSVSSVSSLNASYWQQLFGDSTSKKSKKGEGDDLGSLLMQELDADKNGGLSLEESGLEEKQYNALDTDGDGSVTLEELQAGLELQRQAMMGRIQMEGDESGQSGASRRITGQELLSAIMNGEQLGAPPDGPGGTPPPPPSSSSGDEEDDLISKLFTELDSDESGGLDLSESGLSSAVFDSMDTNQDGVVSADELAAALEKQRTASSSQSDGTAASSATSSSSSTSGASAATNNAAASNAAANNASANLFGGTGRANAFLASIANNAYMASMSQASQGAGVQSMSVTA